MTVKDPIKKEARRIKKNAYTAARYLEKKQTYAIYHQLLSLFGQDDPEYVASKRESVRRYQNNNKAQVQQSAKASREKHKEARLLESKKWFEENPGKRVEYEQVRRARKKNALGSVSAGIWEKLFTLQKGACICCGVDLKKVTANLDHVIPLARGGMHDDRNLQLLCQKCNNQKHSKDPIDFMREKGFLL